MRPILVMLCFLIAACRSNTRAMMAAKALSEAADECLYDVRDRGLRYENASHCSALGPLAQQYIGAGGFQEGAPTDAALVAEQARAVAWMARATSLADGQPVSIW